MNKNIYSIRDTKADAFLPPFYLPNDAMAIREFENAKNDESTAFFRNPEDYTLYCVGIWDDVAGQIVPESSPRYVILTKNMEK